MSTVDPNCEPCKQFIRSKHAEQRIEIIQRLHEKFKEVDSLQTIALVETKNGFISWRKYGDESIAPGRLKVLEYLSFLPGSANEQIH